MISRIPSYSIEKNQEQFKSLKNNYCGKNQIT